jgi:hypothetical protein
VVARFGDKFQDILPSSFDRLPYFAELVQQNIKTFIGSKTSEQQAVILLSRFMKLRYSFDITSKAKGWFC